MTFYNRMAWQEGMLLEPHHFQQQERYLQHQQLSQMRTLQAYYSGITTLSVDRSLLLQGVFSINHCSAVFADGTFYDSETNDLLPDSITIDSCESSKLIWLALDAVVPKQLDHRYQLHSTRSIDRLTGLESHCEYTVAKLKPQLTVKKSCNQLAIAIARLNTKRGNGELELDERFIPACTNIKYFSSIKRFIHQYCAELQHRIDCLCQRTHQSEQSAFNEYIDHSLLQTLNRYHSIFIELQTDYPYHPYRFYRLLIKLQAELASYSSDRRVTRTIPYQHDNISHCLQDLFSVINQMTRNILQQHADEISVSHQENNTYYLDLSAEQLHYRFILCIDTLDLNDDMLINQIKIAPKILMPELVKRALPGITITALRQIPRELPYYNQRSYFELDSSHPFWQELIAKPTLAIHLSHSCQQSEFNCWILKGAA